MGAVWFLVMIFFVARGIRITADAQWVMSTFEVLLLVVFAVLAFAHSHRTLEFSWSWLWFSHFGSAGKLGDGALVAAFYYWGWDVSSNLGEEIAASERNSGACFMFYIFAEALITNSIAGVSRWLGVGGMLVAVVPIAYYSAKASPYLRQKPTLGRIDIGALAPEAAD